MGQVKERRVDLTLEEKRALVARLLKEKAAAGRGAAGLVHRWFEAQAARTPDAIAVTDAARSLAYGQLNARANRLARRLCALGVGPDVLVGLCTTRSVEMVAAMLAVLKAGGAYVPLDPAYPLDRLAFMLADSRAPVLITEERLRQGLPGVDAHVVCLDPDGARSDEESDANLDGSPDPTDLAYVIYTSGSTGRPKGVQVPHAALANLLASMRDTLGITDGDAMLAVTTLSFDIAVLELFLPLIVGARVELVDRETAADGPRLVDRLDATGISFLQATPATWRLLLETGWRGKPGLTMLCGGEAMPRALADRLLDKGDALWNVYGPTETTVWSSAWRVEPGEVPISIGRPIAGTRLHVLDRRLRAVPVGVTGELYIGGTGLARGYRGRPGLTAERFLPDPFSGEPGARLYRTGDLARWRPDGTLECLGRVDHQVKVRGFRVELGEVEAVLAAHPAVREAVVAARPDSTGETSLAAYLVPRVEEADAPSVAELRGWIQGRLPEYMVPSAFVVLGAMPMTPNGKVDRRALPDPARARLAEGDDFVPPRGPIEEALADAWAGLLGGDRIGAHDNFFERGGHSLMAIQLLARIRSLFDVEAPLKDFIEEPTLTRLACLVERALADRVGAAIPPIGRVDRDGPPLASFAQQRLWFLDRLQPGSPAYNVPIAVRLDGLLDVDALRHALAEVVRRHEILRTTFAAEGGLPLQVIAGSIELPMTVEDLSGIAGEHRLDRALALVREEAARPFDLASGPLVRAGLIRLSDREHIVQVTMHHIVSDGWSLGVLIREVSALYDASRRGEPSPLPEPALQYADFAAWQRDWLRGDVLEQQLDYWTGQLAGLTPLELPTDRPRPAVPTGRGGERNVLIPRDRLDAVRSLGREEGATLYMTLLAAFQVLLGRYSGQDDFAVGSPTAGRGWPALEGLIGLFVNTIVLRGDLTGDPSFRELLRRTRRTAIDAYAHQDIPFELLVNAIQPDRESGRSPLFRVMFALQNVPLPALRSPEMSIRPLEVHGGTAKFDLSLFAVESDEGLHLTMEYSSDLFDSETVDRILAHYRILLEMAVAHADRPVGELPMLTEDERRLVLEEWNRTAADYPRDVCLHELFDRQAARKPRSPALLCEGAELSYAELQARANRLAHRLRAAGVVPDSLVGLCLERSVEMVVGLLGVLKAGGAYVPLDPEYPDDRLAFMVSDSDPPVLLTQRRFAGRFAGTGRRVICLDEPDHDPAGVSDKNPEGIARPDNLAYMIYTSGSTGTPKGAMNTHQAIVNRLLWMQEAYGLDPGDRVLQKTPFSFDVSVWEFFWPLITGAALVMARPGGHRDPAYLSRIIAERGITTIHFVPSMLEAFVAAADVARCRRLYRVICSGEALSFDLQERFFARFEGVELHNLYGPTEAAVDVSYWACRPGEGARGVPIGRPIANLRLYVLDARLEPAPVGVTGELYIGGVGLGRGYWRRPALTADRFVPDPFSVEPGGRLYRTGDLARWRADGQIEYLGRIDNQVKIRGFRIELGEIEAAMVAQPGVAQATVVARDDGPGGRSLVAYVVPAPGARLDAAGLRAALGQRLPEYMVPSAFVALAAMPLSPNGKLDRKALPAPTLDGDPTLDGGDEVTPPRGPIEEALAEAWADLLGGGPVGVHDNFFDRGGHSLMALQLLARARQLFEVEVPLKEFIEQPTLARLAALVEQGLAADRGGPQAPPIGRTERSGPLPATFAQQRLWFLDRLAPGSPAYNIPTAVRLDGRLDVDALRRALDEIIRRHEILRTTFADDGGIPRQVIADAIEWPLPVVDLSEVPEDSRRDRAIEVVLAEAARPFDLARGPLVRAGLIRLADDRHIVQVTMHHIISDGWSLGVLIREVSALYDAFRRGEPSPLPEPALQYADFAAWQRDWLHGEVLEQQLDYWTGQLAGLSPLELPTDRPRPAVPTGRGGERNALVPRVLLDAVRGLGREEGATLYMTLLAAFQVLLHRHSGQADIAIGSPVAGRSRAELEGLIGFFVNTLVLRADLRGDPGFRELLRRTRRTAIDAYAHQDLPFERLVTALHPERDSGRAPLFQVMFALQNTPLPAMRSPEMALTPLEAPSGTSKFDLTLYATESPAGLRLTMEYSSDLFEPATVDRMLAHYRVLLEAIVAQPDRPVGSLPMLTEEERRQVLGGWGAGETDDGWGDDGLDVLLEDHPQERALES
jgi:amino acid adenylation domain-containing protein